MSTFIFPGLGATDEMYNHQWKACDDFIFCNWPVYQGEQMISELSESLMTHYKITPKDSVGGSSFGGMIAIEIAQQLNSPNLLLLGSAINTYEVNQFLLALAPIVELTPISLVQWFVSQSKHQLSKMFCKTDPLFIQSMIKSLGDWKGLRSYHNRLIRIHGQKDRIIQCPKTCHSISNAGHLVAMTHPEVCIRLIKDNI